MWETKNNQLVQTFTFKDFIEAFSFMTKVAIVAEKSGHHPELINIYNTVTIKLSTHDANNTITDKDENLAKEIDKL